MKGMPGRGTLEKEKPPIFGMVQRGGAIILHLLANVWQTTIKGGFKFRSEHPPHFVP